LLEDEIMAIHGMNHFNVLTDKLEESRAFYVGVLGFTEGPRPPLDFGGAWMYAGGEPILHISEAKLPADPAGVLDHLAFTASDLKGTVERLKAHRIPYTLRQQVGTHIWQIFCHDPCGARVELDFAPKESAPADG
jgi:catechol 2,3-dioxygenase-like lactoylglutathione lyase family enzyme